MLVVVGVPVSLAASSTARRRADHRPLRAVAELASQHRCVVAPASPAPVFGVTSGDPEGDLEPQVAGAPLDDQGAEHEALLSYHFEQDLENALPGRTVASILTQTVVDPGDPSFAEPTIPVGPPLHSPEAQRLARSLGWVLSGEVLGEPCRRLVASPEPVAIVELRAVRALVDNEVVVVCAAGGGIPVVLDDKGAYRGVDAVVDPALAASLLAARLGADALLLLGDTPAVLVRRNNEARAARRISATTLRGLHLRTPGQGQAAEALARFAETTGRLAAFGAADEAPAVLAGEAGTRIVAGTGETEFWPSGSSPLVASSPGRARLGGAQ